MRLQLLPLLAALSPFVLADVKFLTPAAGTSLPAGPVTITWEDSGTAPAISALTTYTIQLYVGGNDPATDAQPVAVLTATGNFKAGNKFTGTISPKVAGNTANGFYFAITSVVSDGGSIINYSDRFTMTGMTGATGTTFAAAAEALNGAPAGPAQPANNVNNAQPAAAAPAAPAAGEFTVPYNLQTGLTKYAPMQPVPPTKITQNSPTPLFPTSAFVIATTWLPRPTIETTETASQTFSVSSMENPAAPQSQPTGDDMAKFLARWKD